MNFTRAVLLAILFWIGFAIFLVESDWAQGCQIEIFHRYILLKKDCK